MPAKPPTEPRIRKVIRLLTEDLSREVSLDVMARSVNLSASRFRNLFKKEVGISFHQYLKTQRILKAKELLETTFLNVDEVMTEVGIKDKSHFIKDFKKAYRLPPLQYRTNYLTKRISKP